MPRLTALLKESTREVHVAAERSSAMAALIRGDLSRDRYRALLFNLQALYGALERAMMRHRDHPAVAPLWLPGLARSEAIARDLAALGASAEPLELRPATLEHVERLGALANTTPGLLGAHAYVRYLGDLHGGQTLARIVSTRIAGPTSFYDFGPPPAVAAMIRDFRRGLDELPLDEDGTRAFVDEALLGFRLQIALFGDLQ